MKKLFIVLCLSLFALTTNAQVSTLTVYTAKAYSKSSTAVDTSATFNIGSYPYVTLHTTSVGADSTPLVSALDAYINGVWINGIVSSTLTLGHPAGHIPATTKGQVNYLLIRSPATTTTDVLGGAYQFRIRNTHSAFANGSTDSTSATSYTQKIIMRK